MERNVCSLQEQISSADAYYQELCNSLNEQKLHRREIREALSNIELVINDLYGAIQSGTRMSHVGASQAVNALQHAAGHLNAVYQLLDSTHSYTMICAGESSESSNMIHVSPDMSAKQNQLAKFSEEIRALGSQAQQHAVALDSQQANDIDLYQTKSAQMSESISLLSALISEFSDHIAMAYRRYHEAQTDAIFRANSIPY